METIVENSEDLVYNGRILKIWNGPYSFQLVNKMQRAGPTNYKEKDRKDAVKFLEKTKAWTGEKVNIATLTAWGRIIRITPQQTKDIIVGFAKLIQDELAEFDPDVMSFAGC
jgi:hypothetical protein